MCVCVCVARLIQLAIVFSVEDLLIQLQQVLETHEVNWQNVLSFLSTLLVFNPNAQPCLRGPYIIS